MTQKTKQIPLFTDDELKQAKHNDLLYFECNVCGKNFGIIAKRIKENIKYNVRRHIFCSYKCTTQAMTKALIVNCLQCNKQFAKSLSQIKRFPNNFCSNSCAATYNNTHKTKGTRRSKLETWLEEQLTKIYTDLEIKFNGKELINSELDIYVPSLNLAFELNGILHYKPIYGQEKLASIQNNDSKKFQACLEKQIELFVIDTSAQSYIRPKTSQKYLDIITNIINLKFELSCTINGTKKN